MRDPTNEHIPPDLRYQHRLRVIGRHLDQHRFQRVTICDVAQGMLVTGTRSDSRDAEALVLRDDNFHSIVEEAEDARGSGTAYTTHASLFPTGYEDFLRAVGYELDQYLAWHVVINELFTFVTISGFEPNYAPRGHTRFEPFEWIYRADDIRRLLDDAFARRGNAGVIARYRQRRKLKAAGQ